MAKLGLIVNPIAGMGGSVGLRGTDGPEIVARARELGAKSVAPSRAVEALRELDRASIKFNLVTCTGEMGEREANEAEFSPQVIEVTSGETTAEDTKHAAKEMLKLNVDLILIAGGDGTIREVMDAIDARVPILGIPTGVKMFSAVFANTPEIAGKVAARFLDEGLPLHEAEVMDVDEEAFRRDRLESELNGYIQTPYEPQLVQAGKAGTVLTGYERADQKFIARFIVEIMREDILYILGPGTTTRAVAEEVGIKDSSLLGVDLIRNKKILVKDVREEQILREMGDLPSTVVVSPIGKQGFILGRGNQQISPEVVKRVGKENVLVLATSNKLTATPTLRIDTGDSELDREFRGHISVIVGYGLKRTVRVV